MWKLRLVGLNREGSEEGVLALSIYFCTHKKRDDVDRFPSRFEYQYGQCLTWDNILAAQSLLLSAIFLSDFLDDFRHRSKRQTGCPCHREFSFTLKPTIQASPYICFDVSCILNTRFPATAFRTYASPIQFLCFPL